MCTTYGCFKQISSSNIAFFDTLLRIHVCISSLIGLISLFNGLSTIVGYLIPKPSFVEEHSWHYLTHSWRGKIIYIFPKVINLKMYKFICLNLFTVLLSRMLVTMSQRLPTSCELIRVASNLQISEIIFLYLLCLVNFTV